MATYADLKARIIKETERQDLSDDLADILAIHIADAIEEYADTRFWFNQVVQSVSTVADAQSVAIPAAVRIVDRIAGPYGDLAPAILGQFTDDGDLDWTGSPTSYTYVDGDLRLFPIPNEAYALTVYGVAEVAAPTADADSSVWTNEAQALIAAHTRMTLMRDQFRDESGAALAANAVSMHLNRLRRGSDLRLRKRPVARLVGPTGQSVRMAWLDSL